MNYFISLPLEVQVELLIDDGIHLGTSTTSIYRTDLYAVGDELIEVLLLPVSWDFVHIRIADEVHLTKYLPADYLITM